jgi:hypothetical protein
MTDDEQARVKSQYASVELADGANTTAMAAIGSIRGNAQNVQTQIANLEQDSLSADPNLNTEVSVLNKINAQAASAPHARINNSRPSRTANHYCEAATRGHDQCHQCRHLATCQPGRKHGSSQRHVDEFYTELSDALEGVAHTRRVEGATTMDYLQFIFQAINNLLTQNLGFFDAMGQNLFRSFATILVVWYGVKSALSAAGGRHMFNFDNFASLLLTIAFGFAMVNYYSTPIPGMGASFHNLITDESQFLANKINQTELQTVEGESPIRDTYGFTGHHGHPWNDHLCRHHYFARGGPGHRDCRNRIRIHRYCRVRARRTYIHTLLYRPEVGVAVLGLVQMLHPICFLPGHRSGGCLYNRDPHLGILDLSPQGLSRRSNSSKRFRSFSSLSPRLYASENPGATNHILAVRRGVFLPEFRRGSSMNNE